MLAITFLGTTSTVISRYMSAKTALAYGRDLRSDVFEESKVFL